MRVRMALGLAVLAAAVGLIIDMSAAAPRLSGSDHVYWPAVAFVDVVPGGGVVCLPDTVLPADTASMTMLIGGYGKRIPRILTTFIDSGGRRVASGTLSARPETATSLYSLPIDHRHGPAVAGTLCMRDEGRQQLALGGSFQPPGSTINGHVQPGRPSVLYYRPGRETWWSLLGAIDVRLGLGKSPMFGDWTFPLLVVVALALWFGVGRLLVRELR